MLVILIAICSSKIIHKKKNEVKFDVISQSNEEYIRVTIGCIWFIDSYRFLSNRLGSLVKTFLDKNQRTLQNSKKIVGVNEVGFNNHSRRDDIPNIRSETETSINKDWTIEDFEKDFPVDFEKL